MRGLIKRGAFYFVILALILLYFIFPNSVSASVKNALDLCVNVVIPSLFFFFILSNLFIESGLCAVIGRMASKVLSPLFNLSGPCCVAFILSLVSGYPAGGVGAVTLYKSGGCTKRECERLLMFCNNCGPAFIITAIGSSMLGSAQAGGFLYAVHIACAALIGIVSGRFYKKSGDWGKSYEGKPSGSAVDLISGAIKKSTLIMLDVCAVIVTFSALIGLIGSSGLLRSISMAVSDASGLPFAASHSALVGAIELTNGAALLTASNIDPVITLTILSVIIGFGGICVHMQLLPYIREAGLSPIKYFIGKLFHGAAAGTATYIAARFMYRTDTVFAGGRADMSPVLMMGLSVILFFGAALAVFLLAFFVHKKSA